MIRLLLLALVLAAPAAAQEQPLFATDAPLHLVVRAPLGKLAAERREQAATPATLASDGATPLAVTLSPRGITRRAKDTCKFPPLRLRFDAPPPADSPFAGQKRLKLVTHCRPDPDFQQYLLLEYAAYRLYNVLTPLSFRVRLLTIDWLDPDGRPALTRAAFVIEDARDLARRNGLTPARTPSRVPIPSLDPAATARAGMFNYMIGNLDFALNAGPAGSECCHNGRLLTGDGRALRPVPYDFDFAGLVDAPYATPPQNIPLPDVRTRVFRGFCAFNPANRTAASELAARKPALLATLDAVPGLTDRTRTKAAAYLAGFFRVVESPKAVEETLIRNCI